MNIRVVQLALGGLVLLMSAAVPAMADVNLLINDYLENPQNLLLSGSFDSTSSNIQITQEGIGILGGDDAHFEFASTDPSAPAPGVVKVFNYNIYDDPGHTILSDTLSITITGHTPTGRDSNNVSIDEHFRSDSLDGVAPPALANATAITEDGSLKPPSGLPDSTYQYVNSGLTDLKIGFNSSDLPEPGFYGLVGIGMAGMMAFRFRARKQKTAEKT